MLESSRLWESPEIWDVEVKNQKKGEEGVFSFGENWTPVSKLETSPVKSITPQGLC